MDELLDRCYDRVDASTFIQHLESGLRDHYDVKTIAHPMLVKLAAIAPGQVGGGGWGWGCGVAATRVTVRLCALGWV